MKKITVFALLMLAAFSISAQTGSADINPKSVAGNAYKPLINISCKPAADTAFTSGAVEIIIPQDFVPAPSTATAVNNISAVIMSSGVTSTVISPLNISVDGYAVTVNALNLAADQEIVVTYGATGAGGLYPLPIPGKYVFHVSAKSSAVSSFEAVDQQPIIFVTYVGIDKSSPAVSVKAGDTVTYFIEYKNLDANTPLSLISVWDTMPQGMSFLSSYPAESGINGRCINWDIGNLSASLSNMITVIAKANSGIIKHGDVCVNMASVIAANPTAGISGMEAKKELPVTGVILNAAIASNPSSMTPTQDITVVMEITNEGNVEASDVSSTVQVLADLGGVAVLKANPSPFSVLSLKPSSTAMFTWIYTGTSAGTVRFSGYAMADEGSLSVSSMEVFTDNVSITVPTPIFTDTPAIVPTYTFTAVITPVDTLAATPVITVIPSTPTPLPANPEKVRTDKNYINLSAGDRVEIRYTVETPGKTSIKIYNLNGERVRDFYDFDLASGTYAAYWEGTNDKGRKVGKGIYFIMVTQPGSKTIKKIIVTK